MMNGWAERRERTVEDQAWIVGQIIGVHPRRLLRKPQTEEESMAVLEAFMMMQRG